MRDSSIRRHSEPSRRKIMDYLSAIIALSVLDIFWWLRK